MAEFGLAALWLAAALAALQLFAGLSSLRGSEALAGLTRPVAVLQGVLTGVSLWIAVLHQVVGAILVATAAAGLHRLARPAA